MTTREERIATRVAAQEAAIVEARVNGFRNCLEIFEALGIDQVNAGGMTRSSYQVSARYILEAGYKIEDCEIPDYASRIPQSERKGCFDFELAEIVAYKNASDGQRLQREWDLNMEFMLAAREQYGAQTATMNWDVEIESMGERPEFDQLALDAASSRREARQEVLLLLRMATDSEFAKRQAVKEVEDEEVLEWMITYLGPVNQRGYPRNAVIIEETGIRVRGARKRRLWAKALEMRV